MNLSNDQAIALVRGAAAALQQGRAAEARRQLERVTATGRANAQIWLLLATACRAAGDPEAEEAAVNALLRLDPRLPRAHLLKADCRARAGDEQGAVKFYESGLTLANGQRMPDDFMPELKRAEAALAAAYGRLDARREAGLNARGMTPANRSRRFQESLDISAGRRQIFPQAPTSYYFPGLAPIQFFDSARFDWVGDVEAATGAIGAELAGLLADWRDRFRPYLHADPDRPRLDANPLLDSGDWSTLFLCENGVVDEDAIARCPTTWETLKAVPMPWGAKSPTVMFSLLRAGARIPPHTGMFNTRLICHLPLIVPPGCGFRVGNETRAWDWGKLLIFDDSIEHEAWNEGGEDRVVLIFDVWRPELTEQERGEVAALFAGPDATEAGKKSGR